MKKNAFTIIELCVIFLVILGSCFFFLPMGMKSTEKVKLISKWEQKYSEIQYAFESMRNEVNNCTSITKEQFEDILEANFRIVKLLDKVYEPQYKNKKLLSDNDVYNFDKYYLTASDEIVGFKWINDKCVNDEICATMIFDLNGLELPNKFGEDIFGINIYKSKVSALGEGIDTSILRQNCKSSGIYCSYYYLIGGHFE